MNNRIAALFYSVIVPLHIAIPAVIVAQEPNGSPIFSACALTVIVLETLKMLSYAQVNYWCRLSENAKAKTIYPKNLTLADLYYFMLAPTLCYELDFPRTPTRRVSFIAKRIAEMVCLSCLILALSQQWVMPLVRNSIVLFSEMKSSWCAERVLKLAIPNILIWLIYSYLIFHSTLNLIAELMRFADREFYGDFWNSATVMNFWKTWNIPVHRWCLRHVYKPMVRNGWGRQMASLTVFAISAFFHEYLVSVPLHMFRFWACWGMLAQIPLSMITESLKSSLAGNVVMWLSLILGQPMAILMYVHDWYVMSHKRW